MSKYWMPTEPDFTDVFCGAGGSSIGLSASGLKLKLAANHWDRAIETHSANFPGAEHMCADVSNYDWRRAPRTAVAWFSPECTWHSPAGGRRRIRAQLDFFDEYIPTDAGVRSRATMLDVIRATEVHQYPVVIVENVIEAATWPLFNWWLEGMVKLGYHAQVICVSSAHVGDETNPHAPQWRDRLYMFFTRDDLNPPDARPRPSAWCSECDETVRAVQSWKKEGRRVGKYGAQYVYRCPNGRCRHAIVEPFVLPAAAAIDWTDHGTRIGDRPKPLAAATMRRIRAGLELFGQPTVVANHGNTWERPGSDYVRAWPAGEAPLFARTGTPGDGVAAAPFMFAVNHDGDGRHFDPSGQPLPTRSTKIGEGLVQPFVTMLRRNGKPTGVDEPLATFSAGGTHHGLTVPPGAFIQKHHGGLDYARIEHMTKSVQDPLASVVARPNMSLVIPYRRGAKPHVPAATALSAVATREQHGLLHAAADVYDCYFRMLKPREHLRAQRFHDAYVVIGNMGEQTMQAGNAVSANVAQWLGGLAREVIS